MLTGRFLARFILAANVCWIAAGPASAQPSLDGTVPSTGLPTRDIDLGALTLREALEAALSANRDVQSARAALDAARGVLISAGKRPNPTLTVGGGPGLIGQYALRDADILINYSQPIERGNKRELRTEAASAAQDAARLEIDNTLRLLRLSLTAAYFGLKQEDERVQVAKANRDAFSRTIEVAELRLKAGDIARSDLVRLRVEAGRSENEMQQAEADATVSRVVLGVLLARERDAPLIRAIDPWPPSSDVVPRRADMEEVLRARPDVRAVAARERSAVAALDLARALRARDVGVAVVTERNLPANGGTTLGVQLSIPLFINNDYGGEIVRAEAELTSARLNLDRVRGSARAEADRAIAQFNSARAQLVRFEGQIGPDAQWAVDAAEFAYRRGAIPLTDLLDARRQFYGTQRQLLESRTNFAVARAALEASLGRALYEK